MRQNTLAGSWLMIRNWAEWMILQRVLLSFRGGLDRLEKWEKKYLKNFSRRKCKTLLLGKNNNSPQHMLVVHQPGRNSANKNKSVTKGDELTVSQCYSFISKEINSFLGCIGSSIVSPLINTGEILLNFWLH